MIDIQIQSQPDDESCGPTALHSVYRYYGVESDLPELIRTITRSISGGTLAAHLGQHAILKNFDAIIYVNNINVFDPSWFDSEPSNAFLINKLELQLEHKFDPGLKQESDAYINFLKCGGKIKFETITPSLLKEYFARNIPIISGLSATYLYNSPRVIFNDHEGDHDDILGTPCGHFVILCGYDDAHRHVVVADPHETNPISGNNYYKVSIYRLINAIMLGVLTYDANLLVLTPMTGA